MADNKQKRNTAQKIAREKLVEVRQTVDTLSKTGGMVNLDPEWKKMKLLEELENIESTIETSALDHRRGQANFQRGGS